MILLVSVLFDKAMYVNNSEEPLTSAYLTLRLLSPLCAVVPVALVLYYRSVKSQQSYITKSMTNGMRNVSSFVALPGAHAGAKRCWVHEGPNGSIVGCLLLVGNEVEVLVVDEKCRRQGIAKALVSSAEAHCRGSLDPSGAARYNALRLVVTAAQPAARSFYASLGFTTYRTSPPSIFGDQDFFLSKTW